MDQKRLLLLMAERLYEDIKFVTEQNPTQIVDDDGARAYNGLLNRARRFFPTLDVLNDFTEWSPRTIKYKDALVVSGQLAAAVRAMVDSGTSAGVGRPPARPPQAGPPQRPALVSAPWNATTQGAASAPTQITTGAGGQPRQAGPPPAPPPAQQGAQPVPPQAQAHPQAHASAHANAEETPIPTTRQSGGRHDEELYGKTPPSKRNNDGTIPFSLE